MLKNDAIFRLIKSLTPQEKRYYSRFTGTETDYFRMFRLINAMEVYDETSLKKEFNESKHPFQLDVKKHYLHQQVLILMRRFNENSFKDEVHLQEIDILISRKLYDQAIELLKKEKKIAELKENHLALIKILSLQEKMAPQIRSLSKHKLIREKLEHIKRYEVLQRFLHVQEELLEWSAQYSYFRNAAHQKEWKKKLKLVELPVKKESSLQVKLIHEYIHYLYHACSGQWTKAYTHARSMYTKVANHPESTDQFSVHYLNACSAFLGSVAVCKGENLEFRKALQLLTRNAVSMSSPHFRILAQTRIFQFRLIMLKKNNPVLVEKFLQEVVEFVEENEEILESFKLKFIRFDIAKTFYMLKNRRAANKWLLRSVNPGKRGFSKDIFTFSRILFFINEIESGRTEPIPLMIQQLKSQLRKAGVFGDFEMKILHFIGHYYANFNELKAAVKIKALEDLRKEAARFYNSNFGWNFRMYFDFETWAVERLEEIKTPQENSK